jgi:hypothetical protein
MSHSLRYKTLTAAVVCATSFVCPTLGQAEWMIAQGNVAQLEYRDNATYHYTGGGFAIRQSVFSNNWVHLPVPSKFTSTEGARHVRIRFWTGSQASVNAVHVYNGNVRVKAFDALNHIGEKNLTFDLGRKIIFDKGLSISVGISAGEGNTDVIFYSAAANFTP